MWSPRVGKREPPAGEPLRVASSGVGGVWQFAPPRAYELPPVTPAQQVAAMLSYMRARGYLDPPFGYTRERWEAEQRLAERVSAASERWSGYWRQVVMLALPRWERIAIEFEAGRAG